ncbi:MAG: hypothetical protein IKM75_10185 [Bacteroidales bacterium]|jgi:hypothetical protein|nr:hypothetical protein [Bacteroidales bacterium]
MMIGWEAQVWLRHCLEGGILEDPAVDYLAERVDEMDAAALLEAMAILRKRLSEIEVLEGTDEGERIRITKDCRILLPDRFDTEIRLRPLVKTVFLLFLRHPEGIRFGDLPAYRNELLGLYRSITRRAGGPEIEASIDRLIDPGDNSIHEKAANLAAALSKYFPPDRLPAYTLTGKAGTPKRIRLDRSLVEWE